MYILIGPEIQLIGIYPTYTPQSKQRYFYKNGYCNINFVKQTETWKPPKCPLKDNWLSRL